MGRVWPSSTRSLRWGLTTLVAVWAVALVHAGMDYDEAVRQLEDASAKKRAKAAKVLGELARPEAIPHLMRLVSDEERVRKEVAHALGRINDDKALDGLLLFLEDPSSDVRWQALKGIEKNRRLAQRYRYGERFLGLFSRERVTPQFYADPSFLSPELRRALVAALDDEEEKLRTLAIKINGSLRNPLAVEPLVARFDGADEDGQKVIALALMRIADKRAIPFYRQLLSSSRVEFQEFGAQALGWTGDRESAPRLRQLFAAAGDDEPGLSAFYALTQLADPADADLFRRALGHKEDELRRYAAEGLTRIGAEDAKALLTAALAKEEDLEVRNALNYGLIKLGDRSPVKDLARAMTETGVRAQVMGYFRDLGPDYAPDLFPLLEDEDEEVREYTAKLLGILGNRAAVEPLKRVLRDKEEAVVDEARKALARLGEAS